MTRIAGKTLTTPTAHQNVSGTSDTIGFFPYAWPEYNMVKPGWTVDQIPGSTVVSVDGVYHVITITGGNFTSGSFYTFTGKTGLKVTGGLRVGAAAPNVGATFTISDTDFTAANLGPGLFDFGGSIGFGSSGSSTADLAQYRIQFTNFAAPKLAEIQAYFMTNSLVNNGSLGYNFSVVGSGASTISKIILGLDGSNFIIAPVNTFDSNFATDGTIMSSILVSDASTILAFPVEFSLDSPLITHPGSWY
jgi:hypothetical protein